jgi:hypothetical protein
MLEQFAKAGEHLKSIKYFKFWQEGNQAKRFLAMIF